MRVGSRFMGREDENGKEGQLKDDTIGRTDPS